MPWIISAQMVFSSQLFSWDLPRVLLDSTIIWLTIKLGNSLTDWSNWAKVKETSQIVSTWPLGQNVLKLALFNPSWEVEVEEQNEQCGTLSVSSPAIVHSGYSFFCLDALFLRSADAALCDFICMQLTWVTCQLWHGGRGALNVAAEIFKSAPRTHQSLTF